MNRGTPLDKSIHMSPIKDTYDFILGADITYIPETFEDLILSLCDLSSTSSTIFISHELRKQEELAFYSLAKLFFDIEKVGFF